MAQFAFEAEVSQVLRLVINSLYSNKEIFARELLSNASDAIDKARFRALSESDILGEESDFWIRIAPDEEAKTLTIEDNGVGMSRDELIENLGTIAHSGSRQFLEGLAEAGREASGSEALNLIGQFGVGFYSAFLVADRVEVVSRALGAEEAHRWSSDGVEGYAIEPAERAGRGTSVTLHLKEDQAEFARPYRLKQLVERYADYVPHKIEMASGEEGELEQLNKASALWRRPAAEIDDAQYAEFYKHITHDWQDPLAQTHFKIEGTRQFVGLLFLPSQIPFDLHAAGGGRRRGVRLYVKRVFIMDECEELVPVWLRFVRGVIDSDDLPLNVSRELLQDSSTTRVIAKQVAKKTLSLLDDLAKEEDSDRYESFWSLFGAILKEGLHFAPEHAAKIAELVRYHSSKSDGAWISLAAYKERMPEDQEAIYYALGPSIELLEGSPHLEALKKKGYEVLYMTDPVDEWAIQGLTEYDGTKLVSALSAELDLGDDEDQEEREAREVKFKGLTERFASELGDDVGEVRVSSRLTDSPVCLVVPEGGMHAHIERMLRAQDQEVPRTKRILEVNPDHKLIEHLRGLVERDGAQKQLADWIHLLYDQALVAEGSPVEDPPAFARRVTGLMERAAFSELLK